MIDTAFILAAGRGDRLRPITNFIPKPLVQAGGKTLIQRHLEACQSSGLRRVIINHAYRGDQLIDHCQKLHTEKAFSFELKFSAEPEGGLETAGGIINALELLDRQPFLLINADIYCDLSPIQLTNIKLSKDNLGHLVLVPTPDYKQNHDFYLPKQKLEDPSKSNADASHQPCHASPDEQLAGYTFSGVSVLHPQLFDGHPHGKHPLAPLLRKAMDKYQITAEVFPGKWFDIGTQERLNKLREMLNGLPQEKREQQ